jgi:hypothetical protein
VSVHGRARWIPENYRQGEKFDAILGCRGKVIGNVLGEGVEWADDAGCSYLQVCRVYRAGGALSEPSRSWYTFLIVGLGMVVGSLVLNHLEQRRRLQDTALPAVNRTRASASENPLASGRGTRHRERRGSEAATADSRFVPGSFGREMLRAAGVGTLACAAVLAGLMVFLCSPWDHKQMAEELSVCRGVVVEAAVAVYKFERESGHCPGAGPGQSAGPLSSALVSAELLKAGLISTNSAFSRRPPSCSNLACDVWLRPLHFRLDGLEPKAKGMGAGLACIVWSDGPNGRNENGLGDDISASTSGFGKMLRALVDPQRRIMAPK